MASIYVHAECFCGAVYQSGPTVAPAEIDKWERLFHAPCMEHAVERLPAPMPLADCERHQT